MHTACEDLDFIWLQSEIEIFRKMWKDGYHIIDIADKLERVVDEVGILVIDQVRRGRIHERTGGYAGTRQIEYEPGEWSPPSIQSKSWYWLRENDGREVN